MGSVRSHGTSSFARFVLLLGSLALLSAESPSGPASVPSLKRYDLLLPPRGSGPVQYLLQGENGCFTWYFQLPWKSKNVIEALHTSAEDQDHPFRAALSSLLHACLEPILRMVSCLFQGLGPPRPYNGGASPEQFRPFHGCPALRLGRSHLLNSPILSSSQ